MIEREQRSRVLLIVRAVVTSSVETSSVQADFIHSLVVTRFSAQENTCNPPHFLPVALELLRSSGSLLSTVVRAVYNYMNIKSNAYLYFEPYFEPCAK